MGIKIGAVLFWKTAPKGFIKLHVEGFHAQNGVANFGQVLEKLFGILGADALVSDHVGEVLNTVQFQSNSIPLFAYLIGLLILCSNLCFLPLRQEFYNLVE